jgi:hypothetical protein
MVTSLWGIATFKENADPVFFWQVLQWHATIISGSALDSKRSAPQRQPPVTLLIGFTLLADCRFLPAGYLGPAVRHVTNASRSLRFSICQPTTLDQFAEHGMRCVAAGRFSSSIHVRSNGSKRGVPAFPQARPPGSNRSVSGRKPGGTVPCCAEAICCLHYSGPSSRARRLAGHPDVDACGFGVTETTTDARQHGLEAFHQGCSGSSTTSIHCRVPS